MNSFNAIQRAIDFEINRQVEALETGSEIIKQETRLWEENTQRTISMRSKEGASDYRYFPEPDLMAIEVPLTTLARYRSELPTLPAAHRKRYRDDFGLTPYDAALIADDRSIAEFFDTTILTGAEPKQVFNWVMGDVTAYLNENKLKIADIALTPTVLGEMIGLITDGTISSKIAKDILPELIIKGGSVKDLVALKGLTVLAGAELEKIIDEIIAANPKEVEQYKAGKTKLLGFFVGQTMKKTQGRAEPQSTNKLITDKLSSM
jgi:aspartyl-tRNA(Asn)/glutamyl-tRNA(Gln) amidotransferase subunit B